MPFREEKGGFLLEHAKERVQVEQPILRVQVTVTPEVHYSFRSGFFLWISIEG